MGKKVIIWSHVTVEDAMQVFRFMPYIAPFVKKYLTFAYGQADIIFSLSEYTKKLLVDYGIPASKIMVRSNAVDTSKFYPRKVEHEGIVVGTVALVIPRKGTDTFLKLAEKFPENKFVWNGKIYSSLMVKSLPEKLPANVKFTGFVPNVLDAFNSLDIFIFPSYEENQGMAILEAAAVGLPIIVRDIPVYEGWLVHGENCLKAKTDEEFEMCVRSLIEDSNLRSKLAAAALLLAKNESIESQSLQTMTVYKNLMFGS
jgi:1,2-diacylglycerol-3-alpha-glucose alpha-1,2-glucosyltransferase